MAPPTGTHPLIKPQLSIVLPVLNEADQISARLAALAPLRERGAEVVVADGGSSDRTADLAHGLADRVVIAPRGRASQMNAGAQASRGELLLFLHADTRLPPDADTLIRHALTHADPPARWGRFDVQIDGRLAGLRMVAAFMNARSRLTGIATGDQGLFMTRAVFDAVGGFPPIALMEDIAMSRRLLALGRPACLRARVVTSGRRWEQHGLWRTIVLMWRLRLAYFFGADPTRLARRYGYRPPHRHATSDTPPPP